jgi:DNA-binding transcriptional MerR regulator
MGSRKSGLRTVDVARGAGYSVQQVRDLEHDGVLPPAARTPTGYRVHTEIHVRAALAYRALAAGIGPVDAKRVLRAAHRGPMGEVLALIDGAHARLHAERQGLALAREAAGAIVAEAMDTPRRSDAMSVSELATALGVRPSTLRHWDAEGLVVPHRAVHGARTYSPADVRDARIVDQLRRAGYRIEPLRALMPDLRRARRPDELTTAFDARYESITARSRALLAGAAGLNSVLDQRGD